MRTIHERGFGTRNQTESKVGKNDVGIECGRPNQLYILGKCANADVHTDDCAFGI